ncbi:aminopeptidase N-like [Alosa pseudoharengus]|uniref:aminopeptidase N-like n=1 Tax=Alosa pseudoharengus TaxID=34774 RepID=UPI003F8898B3
MARPAISMMLMLSIILPQACAALAAMTTALGVIEDKSAVSPQTETTTPAAPQPWERYRLPDTLSPVHYNITLWPRLTKNEHGLYVFTGHSTVDFECVKETDLILIHSNKLNLTKSSGHHATLTGLGGAVAPTIKTTWLQVTTEYLVIQLNSKLEPGKSYQLYTSFQGELTEDLNGFYRSHYSEGTESIVVAASHLQPTDAREVFPCFDEPALKAVFHVAIIHDHGAIALSNSMDTDVVNITIDGHDVSQTTFKPTKLMSTYLVAFVVCDYSHIKTHEIPDVLIRLWAKRELLVGRYGDYALNITVPLLTRLEAMFDITFPLDKYDQVALPDYSAYPMENWGLVTYREVVLWYDPKLSPHKDREWVTITVAHELAHTWFGNLVTLKWWNDLWLNEAFASYMSYVVSNQVKPDMNLMDMMLLIYPKEIMGQDAQTDSLPLSCPEEEVKTPENIGLMFTQITYSKGVLVLHMLSNFLTETVFLQGLRTYLKQFSFSNVTPANLWHHLQNAVDGSPEVKLPASVGDIMNRWILQMGYPVVTINTTTGTISQRHFLLDPNAVVQRPSFYKYEWIVPITWMKSGIEQIKVWLLHKSDVCEAMKTDREWVLANLNMSGYYRVNYNLENWHRLITQLGANHEEIPAVSRARIIDDAFNLARAKVISTTLALRTTKYLRRERELLPWEAALDNLDYFFHMFQRSAVYSPMQVYLKKQVQPLFRHFKNITSNWTDIPSKHTDKYTQANVISLACEVGLEECRQLVTAWYGEWMSNPDINPIPPHLKQKVYCAALSEGGLREWDFGWQEFNLRADATEHAHSDMRRSLACTRVPRLLHRYVRYMMDPNKNKMLDIAETTSYVASNVVGEPVAWNFVVTKWDDISYSYGPESNELADLILKVTKRFSSKEKVDELQSFRKVLSQAGLDSAVRAVEKAIQRTEDNIRWVAENLEQVQEWFSREGTLRGEDGLE